MLLNIEVIFPPLVFVMSLFMVHCKQERWNKHVFPQPSLVRNFNKCLWTKMYKQIHFAQTQGLIKKTKLSEVEIPGARHISA